MPIIKVEGKKMAEDKEKKSNVDYHDPAWWDWDCGKGDNEPLQDFYKNLLEGMAEKAGIAPKYG
jgi:hypothetical protein